VRWRNSYDAHKWRTGNTYAGEIWRRGNTIRNCPMYDIRLSEHITQKAKAWHLHGKAKWLRLNFDNRDFQ
jgi:hypothetical protein